MADQKTLSTLLKESLGFFTSNISGFLKIVLIAYIPLEIVIIFFLLAITGQATTAEGLSLSRLVLSFLYLIVTIVVTVLYQIAVIRTLEAIDKKQTLGPLASYSAALADIGPYLSVLAWVMVKVLLWSLLLIIPGIIFGVFYSFSGFAFLLDKKQGINALKFSRAVIQPNAWKFVGYSLVSGLIVSFICFVIRIILGIIFGLPMDDHPTLLSLIGQGVGNTVNAFVGIYIFIFYYLLYQDFKKTNAIV